MIHGVAQSLPSAEARNVVVILLSGEGIASVGAFEEAEARGLIERRRSVGDGGILSDQYRVTGAGRRLVVTGGRS